MSGDKIVTVGSATYHVLDEGDLYTIREMYEMDVYKVKSEEVGDGKKVLDIGANIGIFSVWASLQGSSVSAYEPDPRTLAVLKENVNRNGVNSRVTVFSEGVMGASGTREFFSTDQTAHSTFSTEMAKQKENLNPRKLSVSVKSFDEALGDAIWDVVKIDAEGSEYDMLLSSSKLSQIKHLCFEWHCWEGSDVLFSSLCKKLETYFDVKYNPNWNIMSVYSKI